MKRQRAIPCAMTQFQDERAELPALRNVTIFDLWKLDVYSYGNRKGILHNW